MPDPSIFLGSLSFCVAFFLWGCGSAPGSRGEPEGDDRARQRLAMVADQIAARGVDDQRVLAAMRAVPRHLFVPEGLRDVAYRDQALPIGQGQTISQPYVVAVMTEALDVTPGERVLEIGTGSGYQAAVLAELEAEVYTIEIVEPLGRAAREALDATGYDGVRARIGDGYRGWPEAAPFDAIVLTAAPDHVPRPLVEQLAAGGRMVLPVGDRTQELRLLRRTEDGVEEERMIGVRFVPMTGEARD